MIRSQWWFKKYQKHSSLLSINGTRQKGSETFTVWEIFTAWLNISWELAKKSKSTLTMITNWLSYLRKLCSKIYTVWMEVWKCSWRNTEPEWVKLETVNHSKISSTSSKTSSIPWKSKASGSPWLLLKTRNHCLTWSTCWWISLKTKLHILKEVPL